MTDKEFTATYEIAFRLLLFSLFFFPYTVFASELPHREIEVKVASSPTFQSAVEWEKDIRDRIIFVNQIFEPHFNVHFKVVQYINWEPQDETRETDLLMEELRSFIPLGKDQIVIGFHKMSQPFRDDKVADVDTVGSAQYFRGFVVIRDPFAALGSTREQVVLAHEITHLFGGIHITDPDAIMHSSVPAQPVLMLDEANEQIVTATQGVDFQKGMESLSGESVDKVVDIYEKKIRQNPHSDFYYQLGKFYQARKQEAKAISIWEEALQYRYENPHIHFELGNIYYQAGRYALAVRELGSAIAHFVLPSQKKMLADTLNYLGVAYYQQGNTDLAIFNWLKGLSADSDNRILQGNLALAYLERNDLDRGVTELEKLVAKDPEDMTTLSNLGVAYLKSKQYPKAVECLEKALRKKMNPVPATSSGNGDGSTMMNEISESAIRLNLGAAFINLNRYEDAERELEKSRELDPKVPELHPNLAQVYLRLGKHEAAIKEIREGLRYRKDDPYLYAFLAQAYAGLGKNDEAVQAAKEGIRYAPRDDLAVTLHRNIGITYLNQKRYAEALDEFNSSLNLQWKDADTHAFIGLLYMQTGKMEQAMRSLKTALDIDAKHENAKKFLAMIKANSSPHS
ncbi:MAG: tetratricopeptide repeat protein [Candidatus Omnitrophica bacterium]|nr:tetratricopeptide repeat protein [Candidatus Omnitrophota bacterium]